jgi:hypothetical protein
MAIPVTPEEVAMEAGAAPPGVEIHPLQEEVRHPMERAQHPMEEILPKAEAGLPGKVNF